MSTNINIDTEQIEAYLAGSMSPGERISFETALKNNPALSELLHLYQSIEHEMSLTEKFSDQEAALKNTLLDLNTAYFKPATPVVKLSNQQRIYRFAIAAAAMLLLMVAGYRLLEPGKSNIRQLADRYVQEDLAHLSITMDGAKDSLQLGIAAFNKKDYPDAIKWFEAVYAVHPENSDALKYTGIAYLTVKDYARALACFDELAAKKDLFSNPGLFLKAVTLLQRNQGDDKIQAQQLLQQVVNEQLEGNGKAAQWLQH